MINPNPEQFRAAPREGELTPVTALVAKVLGAAVTPLLRTMGLVDAANEIFEKKLAPTDPKSVALARACEDLKVKTTAEFKAQSRTPQEVAVVENYYNGLIRSVS